MYNTIFWGALIVIFAILEIATVGLMCVWFAIGATAAFLVSVFGGSFIWQVVAFIAVSAITLAFTRPLIKKKLIKKVEPTNADMNIGKKAQVIEDIFADTKGRVRLNGLTWSASSGSDIKTGEWCIVTAIQGATLIVTRADNEAVNEKENLSCHTF